MPNPTHPWLWLLAPAWYGGWSLVAFAAFAWDKRAATKGAWRVRERTLLWLVWLGGFIGAWAAMRLVRHKTRKWRFRASPWAAAAIHAAAWTLILTRAG